MGKIRKLPSHIADQIAAGEVVERPASVVRELLENAIDAGASRIKVEISDGGRRLVRVTDNGCGMDRDDLELAVQRHATSKISSEQDLAAIQTLGFRGEAIPSIASVSRFTLTSRVAGAETGWRIVVDFGAPPQLEPVGCPEGTVVEVEDLFMRIPARLRFLKQRQTEAGHISQQVRLHAVARPDTAFTLTSDGRQVLRTSGRETMPAALWPLLGRDLVKKLLPVEARGSAVHVRGYVTPPEEARSSSRAFYFFLNGRNITNRMLWKALGEATRGLFMSRTYPAGVLMLELDPAEVDVNVHPAKQEVRFHRADEVYRAVYHGARRAWEQRHSVPADTESRHADSDAGEAKTGERERRKEIQGGHVGVPDGMAGPPPLPRKESGWKADEARHGLPWELRDAAGTVPSMPSGEQGAADQENEAPVQHHESAPRNTNRSAFPAPDETRDVSSGMLRIIGQYDKSYIIAEGPDGIVIIDQHAAHEGLIFRRLLKQFNKRGCIPAQPLMFPEVVEIRPEDASRLPELLPVLEKLGIRAEEFGPAQLAIKAVPDFLAEGSKAGETARRMIEQLFDAATPRAEDMIHELLSSLACHSAIRANQPLAPEEMKALLDQLDEEKVQNCPHGRPVFQTISRNRIRRGFKRT